MKKAQQLVNKLLDYGIEGVGPLISAEELAQEYLNSPYYTNDERVHALVRYETSKNFGSGFLTGIGGLITLPLSVPAALGASWVVQARMGATIAAIYGHDVKEDRVRTLVLLTLLGNAGEEIIKEAGIKIGQRMTLALIKKVPGRVLIEINKKIGFRLLTKAGEKGIINLTKMIPLVGGVVGGTIDAIACRTVGKIAKKSFRPENLFGPFSGSSS